MRISPEVGSISRLIILSAVVLPQPEGPIRTQTSPAGTVSERASTAGRAPGAYRLVTSRSSRTPPPPRGVACVPAPVDSDAMDPRYPSAPEQRLPPHPAPPTV